MVDATEVEIAGIFGVIAGLLVAFLFLFLIIVLVLYILHGIGLMKIAKKLNVSHAWMAWVPVLNFYLLGKVAFNNIYVQLALPILFILGGSRETTVNGEIITKGTILPSPLDDIMWLAFMILMFVCLYMVYKRMSKKAVIMLVFTILSFGLLTPIFLFAIRKNNIVDNNIPMDSQPTSPVHQMPVEPIMPQPTQNVPEENNQNQNNQ
jgi:hypothetical protein